MLALVDCNSFYASCEQIYRPDLFGKPVVVLSNNDGCVVTRNKEAKALAIPDLEPYFKIKGLLAQHGVQVFSSNYELYGDTSRRIMNLLETFASAIEVYSIDEAFLDVDGFPDWYGHGMAIKRACWKEQRMPVCVGIAPTKTLAKLANHIAKKSNRLDGVCVIENPDDWYKVFQKLPVNKIWGVGSRIAKRLAYWQVHTVEDLRRQDPKAMRRDFGVTLERTIRELNGEACMSLETQPQPKQQIFCSRSFSQRITSLHDLQESVANYAVRAAEKLRQQNSLTTCVYVLVETSRFNPPYYGNSLSTPLLFPSNDSRHIVDAALRLCAHLYRPHYAYAKAGVGLLDLVDSSHQQDDFFTPGQSVQSQAVMQTLDRINHKYGQGSLFLAQQGIKKPWAMARSMKSPAYTTRLADVPVIKL